MDGKINFLITSQIISIFYRDNTILIDKWIIAHLSLILNCSTSKIFTLLENLNNCHDNFGNIKLQVIYICIGWNPKVSFPKPKRMPSIPQRPRIPAPKPPAPPSAPCEHKGPPAKMRGFFGWQQQSRIKDGKENWFYVTLRKITTSLCFMFSKFDLTIDFKYLHFNKKMILQNVVDAIGSK